MLIRKGLIIADPWIGYILDGSKTWEMRSGQTQMRGPFALIRKGTGTISGVATLAGVGWTLTPRHMLETLHLHKFPAEMVRAGVFEKLNTPWILKDVKRLATPVPYEHPSGADAWVDLPEDVSRKIVIQLHDDAGPLGPTIH